MSTPTTTTPRLTTQAVVLIAILAFLVVALVVGLVWLAGDEGRSDVLSWLSSVLLLITGGGAITGVVQNRNLATRVAKIDTQTNGVLDARIANGVHTALIKAGLVPDTGQDGSTATSAGPSIGG